jgi:hypothetical protein
MDFPVSGAYPLESSKKYLPRMVVKMNTNDIQLMKAVLSQIEDSSKRNNLLFLVNYVQISKFNLILLKALLEELRMSGIFVTVDRPHQYMEHLLRLHRIDFSNLLFIDTIAQFSAQDMNDNPDNNNVKWLDSPFQIDLLPEIFCVNPQNPDDAEGKIDLTGMDFIYIDNLSTLLNYNDYNTVKRFLEKYLLKFQTVNNIFIPVVLDGFTHTSLFEVAKGLCDREININHLNARRVDLDEEVRRRSILTERKTLFDLNSFRRCNI